MTELLLMLGKVMPTEMLIEQLEEALLACKVAPTKETEQKLGTMCMLYLSHLSMKDKTDSEMFSAMRKISESQKVAERMDLNDR